MDALAFLQRKTVPKHNFYVLSGDDDFLKRQVRQRLLNTWVPPSDQEFAVVVYAGDQVEFPTIRHELDTLPFLAPCRVVVIENADPFITAHRSALEELANHPPQVGILILEARTFQETTRLAKALPDSARITCKAPASHRLADWCVDWCASHYGKQLSAEAAALLVELAGTSLGVLDQELGKLAVAVGSAESIQASDVQRYVSRSRAADVFRILEAIGAGQPTEALSILQELFSEGEDPLAILAPLSAQLRKLAAVSRYLRQGKNLKEAMDAAGIPAWPKARQNAEQQLRHLGRRRLDKLSEWLAELNAGLKGGDPLPERVQLERFIVQLARPRT
ncbi:MAG: DNA polymerase III subunit delta [Thermogemmata sp.]|nr:DNA polymerase III subunit delta [Thermogemmata sp.]